MARALARAPGDDPLSHGAEGRPVWRVGAGNSRPDPALLRKDSKSTLEEIAANGRRIEAAFNGLGKTIREGMNRAATGVRSSSADIERALTRAGGLGENAFKRQSAALLGAM